MSASIVPTPTSPFFLDQRRRSSSFMSPSPSLQGAADSIDAAHNGGSGAASRTSSRASSPSRSLAAAAAPLRIFDFAKMRNPTFAIRLTSQWSFECTYAELLQYASVLLSLRRLIQPLWLSYATDALQQRQSQTHDEAAGRGVAHGNGIDRAGPSSTVVYLNAFIVILALATLDVRRKSEQLGLRRTSLMLCSALFMISCIISLWPVARSYDGALQSVRQPLPPQTPRREPVKLLEVCTASDQGRQKQCRSASAIRDGLGRQDGLLSTLEEQGLLNVGPAVSDICDHHPLKSDPTLRVEIRTTQGHLITIACYHNG